MRKGRKPCCDKTKVKRGPWSPCEDLKLITHIQKFGHDNWRALPFQAGLLRCGKSCRLRWINYLRPDLKRGNITVEEEATIINLHKEYGNKWAKIASHLPGRTDNEIKNVWNTHLKKKLGTKDSNTKSSHKAKSKKSSLAMTSISSSSSSSETSTVSHGNQHEKRPQDLAKNNTNHTNPNDHELKDLPSPSFSSTTNLSSFDQVDVQRPEEENVTQIHDELFQNPLDPDLDIWYMLEGMSSLFPYNDFQNLELETSLDSSLGKEVTQGDALKHLEIELGLENTGAENNACLADQNANSRIPLIPGSSCSEEIGKSEICPTMDYLQDII